MLDFLKNSWNVYIKFHTKIIIKLNSIYIKIRGGILYSFPFAYINSYNLEDVKTVINIDKATLEVTASSRLRMSADAISDHVKNVNTGLITLTELLRVLIMQ